MRVGFVGLGNMGHFTAANLQKAGHELTVNDLRPETAAELVDNGASTGRTRRAPRRAAPRPYSCPLPGPPDVETVVIGEDGILDAMARRAARSLTSRRTRPSMVRKLAELAAGQRRRFLGTPVSGGTRGARDATLAVMVGGEADLYARFEPVLKAIGPNVFNTGPVGTGNVARLISNQLAFINMMAMNEALLMGAKAGIDLVMLRDIVRSSSGDSFPVGGGARAVLRTGCRLDSRRRWRARTSAWPRSWLTRPESIPVLGRPDPTTTARLTRDNGFAQGRRPGHHQGRRGASRFPGARPLARLTRHAAQLGW